MQNKILTEPELKKLEEYFVIINLVSKMTT